MGDINTVIWGKRVAKQLDQLPERIASKFQVWVDLVMLKGIREARKRPGFHDEPLSGDRTGQRSIRLSKSYRATYVELLGGQVELIEVIEVNKHGY